MKIIKENLTLRAIEYSDLTLFQMWANDPEIQIMLGGWHIPVSIIDQENWYKNINCKSMDQRFTIEDINKDIIGMCNLVNINLKDGVAEIGLIIDKKYQKKGYGKKVVDAICDYSFNELRLNRLETTIIDYNLPSLKLFTEKCGWVLEGHKRKYYFRKGNYHNQNILSILASEYNNNNNNNNNI